MTKDERFKLYDEATELWGLVAQYDQCLEEMAELMLAINKYKRKVLYGEYKDNKEVEDNLIEELADVSMCIEQLRAFSGEDKVEQVFEKKLNKLKQEMVGMRERKNK